MACSIMLKTLFGFRHTSPDGDEGFPGELGVSIAYTLLDNELEIKYSATTNKATPVNISNHAFFNLGGHVRLSTSYL